MSDKDLKFSFAASPEGFDTHINNSIMGYSDMRSMVLQMSDWFVEKHGEYIDIGCSSGALVRDMKDRHNGARCAGVDYEGEFRKDWAKINKSGDLYFFNTDAADMLHTQENDQYDYITSLFTLQFMTTRDRKRVIKEVYDKLRPGGAFIVAEKLRMKHSRVHEMMTFMFYDYKSQNFSAEEILDKERTLRTMMRPNDEFELTDLVLDAGFDIGSIDTFWQNYMFTGWICIK